MSCTSCALRAPGKDELMETLKYAPAAGYKYWGVAGPAFWTPLVAKWLDTEKINRMAAEAGMKGMTETYMRAIPTDSTASALAHVESALVESARLTEALNCPLLVFSGGTRTDGTDGLDNTIAGLKHLLPMIEDLDVKVALEPHRKSQFDNADDYDYIFSRIDHPKLGITVDTGHFHAAGVDTKSFIRKYATRVWNVHVKDHIGAQSVQIGKGEIDLEGIIQVLHEVGFEGALALEIEPEDPENLSRYVGEAYAYLQDIVKKVTGAEAE